LDGIIGIAVCAVLFLLIFVLFRKNTYITVTVKVGDDNILYASPGIKPWISQLFQKGMVEKEGLGKTAAEVLDVWTYRKYAQTDSVYLTVKLLSTYNRSSGQYVYRGKNLAIGSTVRMYLNGVLVDGLITNIDGVKDNRVYKTILVEADVKDETPVYPESSGARPSIAEALSVGMTTYDNKNKQIAKIINKQVADAKRFIITNSGNTFVGTNPLRKNISLTLELYVTKINNNYFILDDIPVLIGYAFPLNLPNLSIEPEITKIIKEE
jgi:hypothetical protein